MRLIDADALFDAAFKVWGDEVDAGETNLFMEMINNALTITTPPNNPLTLDELRVMDGEPVWVDFLKCPEASGWMLISVSRHCVYDGLLGNCDFENCGKNWLAYRRRPEEVTG